MLQHIGQVLARMLPSCEEQGDLAALLRGHDP